MDPLSMTKPAQSASASRCFAWGECKPIICIQNKEQEHDNSIKVREFFIYIINKKFSRVFFIFLDTKISILLPQSSIIKFFTHLIIQD